ncbi:MAG: hypothetical protein ACK56F_33010, partial [bacterium]
MTTQGCPYQSHSAILGQVAAGSDLVVLAIPTDEAVDPNFNGSAGLKSEIACQILAVSPGFRNVASLKGKHGDFGLAAQT